MAVRDASRVQLDFPQLTADLIAQLRLTGVVGLLELLTEVRPVYIVASRAGALNVSTNLPLFQASEIIGSGAANAAANAIIGDTGPLAAGDYDIFASIDVVAKTNVGANTAVILQHRDAANAVTIASLLFAGHLGAADLASHAQLPLTGYQIALNERLRFINSVSSMIGHIGTVIGVRLRPTP